MFRLAVDRSNGLALGVFSGHENSDADFQAYINTFDELDRMGVEIRHLRCAYVLIVDSGNPHPNAMWRKRIADASANIRSNPLVALVSTSAAVRSVITAINWFRPPKYDIRAYDTLENAAKWIGALRGEELTERLQRLERECRGNTTGKLSRTA